jgi:hypothetical protein
MSNDPMWELEELLKRVNHEDAASDSDYAPLPDEEHCVSDQEMPTKSRTNSPPPSHQATAVDRSSVHVHVIISTSDGRSGHISVTVSTM